MQKLQRQTDYSLGELLGFLNAGYVHGCGGGCNRPGRGLPIGLIVNEISAMFANENNADAEAALTELLANPEINARFIAYCALKRAGDTISADTRQKLENFSTDPANAEVIEKAQRRLASE